MFQSNTASCEPSRASFSRSRARLAWRSARSCARRVRASIHTSGAMRASGTATSTTWSSESLKPQGSSGFICGNRITSRIDGLSVNSIARRSIPMPSPAVGGRPYSSARM